LLYCHAGCNISTINDEVGHAFAEVIANSVSSVAKSVKIFDLKTVYPELQNKGDISDILAKEDSKYVEQLLSELKANTSEYELTCEPTSASNKVAQLPYNQALYTLICEINPKEQGKYTPNDKGFGELFADVFKDRCRYNATAKSWYYYNGKIWIEDVGNMKTRGCAEELYQVLAVYSLKFGEEERKGAFCKYIVN